MRRTLAIGGLALLVALAAVSVAVAATIDGTDRGERLIGTRAHDVIRGAGGDDHVFARAGRDLVRGMAGDDRVHGGPGDDNLFGGWGSDRVYGGRGDDRLHALARDGSHDLLECGPGDDVAFVRDGELVTLSGCETVRAVPREAEVDDDSSSTESIDGVAEAA